MRHPRTFLNAAVAAIALLAVAPAAHAQGHAAVFSRDGVDVWAVGDSGRYYRSFNSGAGVTFANLGARPLRAVGARGFTVIVAGDSGKIWRSVNSGGAWAITVAPGAPDLRGLDLPSDQVGFVVGANGTLRKTVNGGASWSALSSGTATTLNAVRFTDDLNGWIVGNGGFAARTVDGGTNWTTVALGTTRDLYAVDASGASVWIVGGYGTAFRSVNAGAHFDPVNLKLDASPDVRAVRLLSPTTVVLGGGGGFLHYSDDNGATWTFPKHTMHGAISSIACAGSHVFAVSDRNRALLHSADGGVTWSINGTLTRTWTNKLQRALTVRGNTFTINPQNRNTIFCALGDTIYRTRDDGESWTPINKIPGIIKLNAFIVSPKDSNTWVAAVSTNMIDGHIQKTTNAGTLWNTYLTSPFGEYGIPLERHPDKPDTLFFGGDSTFADSNSGRLYRSTDFGSTWAAYSTHRFRSPCDLVVVPDSEAIVEVGDGVTGSADPGLLWRSTDGGVTFTMRQTGNASEIPGLACSRLRPSATLSTSWSAAGARLTSDYGATWPQIGAMSLIASTWGVDICREDPNFAIIGLYSGGGTYVTYDGGGTFVNTPLTGSNYSIFIRDRATVLSAQSSGLWKMGFSYAITPTTAQAMTVTSPNGGEAWTGGSVHAITWSATNVAIARIEYQKSPGDPWQPVADIPGYAGSYDWTVPMDATTQALVRVSDAWDAAPLDPSNATFTIQLPTLAVHPDTLDFGFVVVGARKDSLLALSNSGAGGAAIGPVDSGSPRFWAWRSSFALGPGSGDTLGVSYAPVTYGPESTTLTIPANDPASPHLVLLKGWGVQNVQVDPAPPLAFALWQNTPNPFAGATVIRFTLPARAEVALEVFDLQGNRVATLARGIQDAGAHSAVFGPAFARGSRLGSGVYFCRLRAGASVATRKMLLLH